MTALSLVFALFELNPAPFCMLDEVDAPLDDINASRFVAMVEEMSDRVQFIFITHNKISLGTKVIKDGNNVKVIINEIINPIVIIHPKSIIGFISLKIKDRKAITVVRTVYNIGQNILFVVKIIKSEIFFSGKLSLNCRKRVLI